MFKSLSKAYSRLAQPVLWSTQIREKFLNIYGGKVVVGLIFTPLWPVTNNVRRTFLLILIHRKLGGKFLLSSTLSSSYKILIETKTSIATLHYNNNKVFSS